MYLGGVWRGRRLIGAQSAGLLLLVLLTAAVATLLLTFGWASTSDAAGAGFAAGVLLSTGYMAATARMFVRGRTLYVVSAVNTFVVDLAVIQDIDDGNGLFLRMSDGRDVGSMAFGSSLIAALTGNRRSKRAALRLRFELEHLPDSGGGRAPGSWHLRKAALTTCFVVTAATTALARLFPT